MKKLMVAMAIAGAVGMAQASFSDLEGFENLTVGNKLSIDKSGFTWSWTAAAADIESGLLTESVITNYAGTGDQKYSEDAGDNFLALTGVERLERYVVPQDNETETPFNVTSNLYIDTLVKFTVTEDDDPVPAEGDKLCVWVGITNGVTNVMVKAGFVTNARGNTEFASYVTTTTFTESDLNEWHRLTVVAYAYPEGRVLPLSFVIMLDGTPVSADISQFAEGITLNWKDSTISGFAANNQLFPSRIGYGGTDADTICSIGFKGSGAIDNLQFSETDPNPQQGEDWKDPTDSAAMAAISNKTAAVAYPSLDGTPLAGADAVKLTLWATDATKGNLAFSDAGTVTTETVEAFLLNCAVADVATEKAEFTVNITWNETDQVWDVTGPSGKTYNGTLTIKGSADLTTPKPWGEYNAATHKFMYGVLEF